MQLIAQGSNYDTIFYASLNTLVYNPFTCYARWWSRETVVVVTGANKGIGLALIRRFAKLGLTAVLTARDATKGNEAVNSLKAEGLRNVDFHQLDVTNPRSVATFTSWLRQRFGGLDILVRLALLYFTALYILIEHQVTVINDKMGDP